MIKLKIASPLDKFFLTASIEDAKAYEPTPVFRGERAAFHILYAAPDASYLKEPCRASASAENGISVRLYDVGHVPVRVPCYPDSYDDGYMSTTPGLYPDIMREISESSLLYAPQSGVNMLRAELDVPQGAPAGEYEIEVTFSALNGESVSEKVKLTVLDAALPPQQTVVMQWIHVDCIANYYGIEPLSDVHFEYLKKAISCAVKNGVNAVLTPVFTPPLDTEVGGERLTVQLVDVCRNSGKWSFGFEKLDRFINIALEVGAEYFEVSHLFTQWGAFHAPKIMATVDGEETKVFGWETDAASEEYVSFLREFLTKFISHMKSRGLDKRCIFHISDEPHDDHEESYRHAVESVRDILSGYTVADALSDTPFYEKGLCSCPIPGVDHAKNFLPMIPEGLWVYYCCSQMVNVSNRFIAQPLSRTRAIGVQMWKYRCTGFLHWAFNFYNSQYSRYPIDPYICTDGDYFSPAGDTFSVYPGESGEPVPSLRLRTFYEALCDIRALEAAEAKHGREAILVAVEEDLDTPLTFDHCPDGEYFVSLRRKIAEMMS